jgi:hypothetical protein
MSRDITTAFSDLLELFLAIKSAAHWIILLLATLRHLTPKSRLKVSPLLLLELFWPGRCNVYQLCFFSSHSYH